MFREVGEDEEVDRWGSLIAWNESGAMSPPGGNRANGSGRQWR